MNLLHHLDFNSLPVACWRLLNFLHCIINNNEINRRGGKKKKSELQLCVCVCVCVCVCFFVFFKKNIFDCPHYPTHVDALIKLSDRPVDMVEQLVAERWCQDGLFLTEHTKLMERRGMSKTRAKIESYFFLLWKFILLFSLTSRRTFADAHSNTRSSLNFEIFWQASSPKPWNIIIIIII